jgi:DNA repair protein RecN (Recombination protein N)
LPGPSRAGATRAAWRRLQEARKARTEAAARLDALRAEEDFLRHAVAELDKLDPRPGEEAELDARRRLMQAAERLRGDVDRARAALGEAGAERQILDAMRWLEARPRGSRGGWMVRSRRWAGR